MSSARWWLASADKRALLARPRRRMPQPLLLLSRDRLDLLDPKVSPDVTGLQARKVPQGRRDP
jgi:hypothetical protein